MAIQIVIQRTHISILGSPAVGKLTIANVLSQQLGYPVFDNAKIVDLVSLIHTYGTANFRIYRDYLRHSFYEEALANSNIGGLISTNVLRHPDNWTYFDNVANRFKDSGWETKYIMLTASNEELLNRVISEGRKSKTTIYSKDHLLIWLKNNPLCNSLNNHACHVIDTSKSNAEQTANQIIEFLGKDHDSRLYPP